MPVMLPLMPVVAGWESSTSQPSSGFDGAVQVIDAVAELLGQDAVAGLRNAAVAGDPAGHRRALRELSSRSPKRCCAV